MTDNSDFKNSVRAASTGNLVLSGLQTVDTVVLNDAERVLVKDQADPTENGLYQARVGAWNRTADADASSEIERGLQVLVDEGSQALQEWVLTTAGPVVIGASPLTFAQTFVGGGGGSDVAAYQILTQTENWNSTYQQLTEPVLNLVGDGVRDMEIELSVGLFGVDVPAGGAYLPDEFYVVVHDVPFANIYGQLYNTLHNGDQANSRRIDTPINLRFGLPAFVGPLQLAVDIGLANGVARPQIFSAGFGYTGLFSAKWLS